MRIGINASFLRKPGTGIGQVTFNFLEKLKEFSIFNFQFSNDESTEFFIYTESEFLAQDYPRNFHFKNFLPFWKRDDVIRKWLWERQVAREAMKDGCDAFISLYQSSTVFPASLINHQRSSVHHTMVVHDIIPRLFPSYRGNLRQAWHWKMVEQGITQADHIAAVSQQTKNDLVRELHIPESKISVTSPSVAPRFQQRISQETLATILQKYGLSEGYIYHGGGLEIRKNTETLLRAYKSLCDRIQDTGYMMQDKKDSNITVPLLVITGKIFNKTNKLATDVTGLIQELQLEGKVRLLGFVADEDMPALYQGASFFVYPSLYEGFGLPVLEALSLGVPTLTSAVSSLPEVGGDAVIYADPESIKDVARQMTRLLTDETLRATLSAKSREQARLFNWEPFVRNILTIIQESRQ